MANLSVHSSPFVQLPADHTRQVRPAHCPDTAAAPAAAHDKAEVASHHDGLAMKTLKFAGSTLTGSIAGAGAGYLMGALVSPAHMAGTGPGLGMFIGAGAGIAASTAVSSIGALRGHNSVALGTAAGAIAGGLAFAGMSAVVDGGASLNPAMIGISATLGAISGAAAAYSAHKMHGH